MTVAGCPGLTSCSRSRFQGRRSRPWAVRLRGDRAPAGGLRNSAPYSRADARSERSERRDGMEIALGLRGGSGQRHSSGDLLRGHSSSEAPRPRPWVQAPEQCGHGLCTGRRIARTPSHCEGEVLYCAGDNRGPLGLRTAPGRAQCLPMRGTYCPACEDTGPGTELLLG